MIYQHELNPVLERQYRPTFFLCCEFQIYSDDYVSDRKHQTNVSFLDKTLFLTPSKRSPLARSFPAPNFTICANFNLQYRIVLVASEA